MFADQNQPHIVGWRRDDVSAFIATRWTIFRLKLHRQYFSRILCNFEVSAKISAVRLPDVFQSAPGGILAGMWIVVVVSVAKLVDFERGQISYPNSMGITVLPCG